MSYSVYPEVLFLLVFSSFFVWTSAKFKSQGAQKFFKVLWLCLLIAYAAGLIWMALVNRTAGESHHYINLDLFSSYIHTVKVYNTFDVFKQIVDNILVFIPLGILLPAAYGAKHEMKNYVFVVFAGLFVSLVIEVLQYVFAIGFTEADDVINNTWGSMIGCGIYALTGKIELKKDSLLLKKGWLSCLMPLIAFVLVMGFMWCYREYVLFGR